VVWAARAASVVHLFMEQGVDPQHMSVEGFGEYRPAGDNATPEGRNRNRRVVLVVLAEPGKPIALGDAVAVTPVQSGSSAEPAAAPSAAPSAAASTEAGGTVSASTAASTSASSASSAATPPAAEALAASDPAPSSGHAATAAEAP
jgi:chemotaxis protein MotB